MCPTGQQRARKGDPMALLWLLVLLLVIFRSSAESLSATSSGSSSSWRWWSRSWRSCRDRSDTRDKAARTVRAACIWGCRDRLVLVDVEVDPHEDQRPEERRQQGRDDLLEVVQM